MYCHMRGILLVDCLCASTCSQKICLCPTPVCISRTSAAPPPGSWPPFFGLPPASGNLRMSTPRLPSCQTVVCIFLLALVSCTSDTVDSGSSGIEIGSSRSSSLVVLCLAKHGWCRCRARPCGMTRSGTLGRWCNPVLSKVGGCNLCNVCSGRRCEGLPHSKQRMRCAAGPHTRDKAQADKQGTGTWGIRILCKYVRSRCYSYYPYYNFTVNPGFFIVLTYPE